MGLDSYVWAVDPKNALVVEDTELKLKEGNKPEELFYWRKHHDLHNWMENLYRIKGGQNEFNCEKVRILKEDLDNLEQAVIANNLSDEPLNEDYISNDMFFIAKAREAIDDGKAIYYDSWW